MARHAVEWQPIARGAKIIFMVAALKRLPLAHPSFAGLLRRTRARGSVVIAVLACLSVHGADISSYKIGDVAQEDIKATVPFDVVNAVATDALKSSRAIAIPAIYREDTQMTNVIIKKFFTAFTTARSNFYKAVAAAYGKPSVDSITADGPDFGYFVTDFNVENKGFPIPPALAKDWAQGNTGAEFRDKWLDALLASMNGHVRPDHLPPLFVIHKNIRVVPVNSMDETFSLDGANKHGVVIVATNIPTITHLRKVFRDQFSPDEQPLARVLANFIQPDCLPDVELTQAARDDAVRGVVVTDHFDKDQLIVARGKTIDAEAKAALDVYSEKLIPGALNQQIAAEHQRTVEEQQRADQAQQRAQAEHQAAALAQQQQQQAIADREAAQQRALDEQAHAAAMQEQALAAQTLALKIHERNEWLMAAVGGISVLAAAVLFRLVSQRRMVPITVPARLQRMEKSPATVPAELAPYLAERLKEAVVQGLAQQRAELLDAQKMAAQEIAELVNRLDQLQAPMQERLRAYQDRIQELQKELTQRTEENRELLKMKIEMMRKHLESERSRVKLN
jgi:7TM-HD extracellular